MTTKQGASVKKELVSLITYPYSDPSPMPEFGRLYPYNRFDGYAHNGTNQDWEMVVMENDYIKLWINPAVGGKIWGAIEKSTGKEFIYFNHSAKFRDVAMRGPWTSGGMETNMGIIGHTPSCSAPVDYHICDNADGSVSCFIGATDWPSRTVWTVEVCLPVDTASFITRSSWYNNSSLEQSYYQWNNIGVKVAGNLQYINPGHQRIGHDGKHATWPVDEQKRNISWYDKNDFGEYKSYHIFGSYSDFWGCYWHDDDFGFGHSATYDDKPGKKIWIWGLSRYGMIWENLLTDSDGQYTEVQSGRLFNQSIAQSSKTPFKHNSFSPHSFDQWDEYWFPVKNIGGLTYGNHQLSFNLTQINGTKQLHLCAIQNINATLHIISNDKTILAQPIVLNAMQTSIVKLPHLVITDQLKIKLNDSLIYNANEQSYNLARPVDTADTYDFNSIQAVYIQAKEWERQRFFERAIEQYQACLKKDPFFTEALTGLAGILIRQVKYKEALGLLKTALSVNTYNAETNYLYGIANLKLSLVIDAKDGFSIASQSLQYRSASYTELAKILVTERQLDKSLSYIKKALQYNTQNQQALQLQLIIARLQQHTDQAIQLAYTMLKANPLNHLVRFELYQLGQITSGTFNECITSELLYEIYLEISSFYFGLKLYDTSIQILSFTPKYALVSIWKAYLYSLKGDTLKCSEHIEYAIALQPDFVFPHREEDIELLEWAITTHPSWKFKYYLALAYTQILRRDEALALLTTCNNESDFYVFYLIRANLQHNANMREADLYKAYEQAPAEWRTALILSKHLAEKGEWLKAADIIEKGYTQNPNNYYLGLQLAKCLMHTGNFKACITLMNGLNVLPNEGASNGRNIWKETHLLAALRDMEQTNWQQALYYIAQARHWPENLGVGKPYDVDERLENFMELHCLQQLSQPISPILINSIADYRNIQNDTPYSSNDFLTIYLLHQHDKAELANLILNNWLEQNPTDPAAAWAVAFINNDTEKLAEIAQIEIPKKIPLPYEILFEDRSFRFVKEMYNRQFFSIMHNALKQMQKSY